MLVRLVYRSSAAYQSLDLQCKSFRIQSTTVDDHSDTLLRNHFDGLLKSFPGSSFISRMLSLSPCLGIVRKIDFYTLELRTAVVS